MIVAVVRKQVLLLLFFIFITNLDFLKSLLFVIFKIYLVQSLKAKNSYFEPVQIFIFTF